MLYELDISFIRKIFIKEKYMKYINRFFKRIEIEKEETVKGLGCCWIWTKGFWNHGYAKVWWVDREIKGSRLSYKLFVGKLFKGKVICHKCDNRKCVNPNHLWQDYQYNNINDMVIKGRHSRGEKHSEIMKKTALRGENHPFVKNPELACRGKKLSDIMKRVAARGEGKIKMSKLKEKDILDIRYKYSNDIKNMRELGEEYSVSQKQISVIISRKQWSHI